MSPEYVVEPDGTITFEPTPEDYARLRDTERELYNGQDD